VGTVSLPGLLAMLGAVATASLFTVLSRKISSDFSPFERTYTMCALGAAVFSAAAFLQAGLHPQTLLAPLSDAGFWLSIFYLAVFSSVLAFGALNYATTHIRIAYTAIFANITTVISILAGVLILRENFGPFQIIGSLIIIACVCGVNLPAKLKPVVADMPDIEVPGL
jgi:drug/metabolite transporter (DMT)-like permease